MGLLEGLLERRSGVPAKATTGRGVEMWNSGIPLRSTLSGPVERAETALAAYQWSPYIRQAERAIKNRLSTIEWWLEDGDGERVTDESRPELIAIRDTIEMPYRPEMDEPQAASPKTRAGLWDITIRHTGCAGYGFWYLDQINGLSKTPLQTLYISPNRMVPDIEGGNLTGWILDPQSRNPARFTIEEVIMFPLEPADEGFLPTGLVHTALAKAELARYGDFHAGQTMRTSGRQPGMYAPPTGSSIPDDVFENLKRDLRAIGEMPDAAKRSLILKGPVEYTATAQTIKDMAWLDVMAMTRDDIHGLWGVPPSQMGYKRESSIGGTADDLDWETMWRVACRPRFEAFLEVFQTQYLDRYQKLGIKLNIAYDEPEFDDKAPMYDMAQKAQVIPMRTWERRTIVGLEPLGDDRDEDIWMPQGLVKVQTDATIGKDTVESIGSLIRAGYVPEGITTALGVPSMPHTGLAPITVQPLPDAAATPSPFGKATMPDVDKVSAAIAKFLEDQAKRVGRKMEAAAKHLTGKPKDTSVWWDEKAEDAALMRVLQPFITAAASAEAGAAKTRMGKAALDMNTLTRATQRRLASRVKGINRTTRDRIRDLTVEAVADGASPSELGRVLRGVVDPLESDAFGYDLKQRLGNFGSELRAETIARTEMRVAQNAAQIDSFAALGAERLEVIDGDDDAECAARDGRIVTMAEAEDMMAEEHPNGTLTFLPADEGGE